MKSSENGDRPHSRPNGALPKATLGMQAYDDLLPAAVRNSDDVVEFPIATTDFLKQELGVDRLNDIHDWLWLVGRPMPPRPLYYQKAAQREIIIHERMELHLVWEDRRMFFKPIPRYLFDQRFWEENLSCEKGGLAPSEEDDQYRRYDDINGHPETTSLCGCERCKLHACALGFMLSYTSLISYENDLRIAKEASLVPADLTWHDWRYHVKSLLASEKVCEINKRYIYGELRLSRLNKIYRWTLRAPIRGFSSGYSSYNSFWHDNLVRVASLFAYLVVVLTAMQVGLATTHLQNDSIFQQASYGFTVFSIIAPPVFLGLVLMIFFIIFLFNLVATIQYRKKRFQKIQAARALKSA